MDNGTIIAMTVIGISSAIGEKVLDSMGKNNLANYLGVASVASLGVMALGIVGKLITTLRGM